MYGKFRLPLCFVLAVALSACGAPGGGRPPPGMDGSQGESGGGCKTVSEQNREAFAQAARLLALSPTQQVLWEDYEASVHVLVDEQLRSAPSRSARRSALQQLEAKNEALRQRIAQMDEVSTRAAKLYAALDDAQKRIADQQLAATVPELYGATVCISGGGERGRGGGASGSGGPGGPGGGAPR